MSSIISREMIRERARCAFAAGKGRDDHNMNWNAAALPTWLEEYDRMAVEAKHQAQRQDVLGSALSELNAKAGGLENFRPSLKHRERTA